MYKYTTLFLIFLTTFLNSCNPRHKGTNIDKELYEIYVEFLEDCESYGVNIDNYPRLSNLKLNEMSEETVGVCVTDETLFMKYRNVYVNDIIKDRFLLKFIAYHEMGHCIFGLEHDNSERLRLMTEEINLEYRDLYYKNWDNMKYLYFKKVREIKQATINDEDSYCKIEGYEKN